MSGAESFFVQNAYATNVESVKDCSDVHFFEIIDDLWKGKHCPPHPLHRFFTLMRKMRAGSFVKEELEFMGPVRVKDVEESQMKIVEVIRSLEEEGEIVISGRGGEEEIVA